MSCIGPFSVRVCIKCRLCYYFTAMYYFKKFSFHSNIIMFIENYVRILTEIQVLLNEIFFFSLVLDKVVKE